MASQTYISVSQGLKPSHCSGGTDGETMTLFRTASEFAYVHGEIKISLFNSVKLKT